MYLDSGTRLGCGKAVQPRGRLWVECKFCSDTRASLSVKGDLGYAAVPSDLLEMLIQWLSLTAWQSSCTT
jgi:hypothetical protein